MREQPFYCSGENEHVAVPVGRVHGIGVNVCVVRLERGNREQSQSVRQTES